MPRRAKKIKRKRGKPAINIDWEMVDELLEANCHGTHIAARIGCHPDTLYDRCEQDKGVIFSEYSAQKKASGDALLHKKQFDTAMKGDRPMLMFLGQQRLGQANQIHQKIETKQEITQRTLLELPDNGRRTP